MSLKLCAICQKQFKATAKKRFCSGGCRLEYQRRTVNGIGPNSLLVVRFKVFKRDGFRCVYCGRAPLLDESVLLELEHLIPRSQGGTNEMENLVTSCRECNIGKGDTLGVAEILNRLKKRQDGI